MKKIVIVLLATAVLSTPCFAKGYMEDALACGYSDYFHLGRDSVSNISIASISGDTNVIVGKTDASSFFIKDTPACPQNGGIAKVRYQIDKSNYCDLTIQDAENYWHPEIIAICSGNLHFAGKEHDGIGSYSYSLSFY